MSQVIQGTNLRLIFADTPPSGTNTANPVYNTLHHPTHSYGAANPYANQPSLYGGGGGYAAPSVAYPQQQRQNNQPFGRDEILMVSDDRVLTLRLAPPVPLDGAL